MDQAIQRLLTAALECSVFIEPLDPGLTGQELLEVGKRCNYRDGEINDAARNIPRRFGAGKIMLDDSSLSSWRFLSAEEPEYRNFAAFDFVYTELNERVREDGAGRAQLDRVMLVERAVGAGISRRDIEVALTYLRLAGLITENDGVVRYPPPGPVRLQLPSKARELMGGQPEKKLHRQRAYPIVEDIIRRRADGRPLNVEPLDAFAEKLGGLGYGPFVIWWRQMVAEVRKGDAMVTPTSVTVLSGALVEGALTFLVKHARTLDLPPFKSPTFREDPRRWKIDDLVASAATGGADAILGPPLRARAEILIRDRQRIHAGRILSEHPQGVPDVRPEAAREAKAAAEQVVRAVLDWLEKYPPAP